MSQIPQTLGLSFLAALVAASALADDALSYSFGVRHYRSEVASGTATLFDIGAQYDFGSVFVQGDLQVNQISGSAQTLNDTTLHLGYNLSDALALGVYASHFNVSSFFQRDQTGLEAVYRGQIGQSGYKVEGFAARDTTAYFGGTVHIYGLSTQVSLASGIGLSAAREWQTFPSGITFQTTEVSASYDFGKGISAEIGVNNRDNLPSDNDYFIGLTFRPGAEQTFGRRGVNKNNPLD